VQRGALFRISAKDCERFLPKEHQGQGDRIKDQGHWECTTKVSCRGLVKELTDNEMVTAQLDLKVSRPWLLVFTDFICRSLS